MNSFTITFVILNFYFVVQALVDDLPKTKLKLLPDKKDCGFLYEEKIVSVGGEQTKLEEFPWMALLRFVTPKNKTDFTCGGALINKRYVLTAAHCIRGNSVAKNWSLVSVRLGEYNKDSDDDCVDYGYKKYCLTLPPIDVEIEDVVTHENYNPNDDNQRNDIALLRLKKDVSYTDYIKPICLPLREEEKFVTSRYVIVAGWGQTEKSSSSSVKLKVQLPFRTNSYCNSIYVEADRSLDDKQMCAGGQKGKDTCKGDSGGPLMAVGESDDRVYWYIAGIVSYGPDPCGTEYWPSVYTRVPPYLGWILEHIKE